MTADDLLHTCLGVSAREGTSFDHHPTICTDRTGRTWVAWTSYSDGADAVLARSLCDSDLGAPITLSSVPGAEGAPCMVPFRDGVFVAWPALRGGAWSIYGRAVDASGPGPEQRLSDGPADLQPALAVGADEELYLAWRGLIEGTPRILLRALREGAWDAPAVVSQGPGRPQRPRLVCGPEGVLWIAWDAYFDNSYHVFARRWGEEASQVSLPGQRQLMPDLALDANGTPWLAWLEVADLATPDGVVDQHHYLCCARHDGSAWELLTAPGMANGRVADLAHGLMPNPMMRGYLGRRRNSMLLACDDGMWLLWERKRVQGGMTGEADGALCGRRWQQEEWSAPVELQTGARHYVVDRVGGGARVRWVGKSCAAANQHALIVGESDLGTERKLEVFEAVWPWREVSLPCAGKPARETISAGGTDYQLYWGDLHCHSVLSSDAEGEPDELLAYARDRAGLDVCVLIDNDCYLVPMLNHEYRIGCQAAAEYTEPGRFVALTGYEWTWRRPDNSTEHRYVLYPGQGGPIVRWSDLVEPSIEILAEEVASSSGIMHAHHHDWKLLDLPVEANVEVCSGWGIYIDEPSVIHDHLNRGMRFGFTGSSDNHRRCPGLGGALTGIYATELSPWAIFEALMARHCYATTGERVFMDFRVCGAVMGSEVVCEDPPCVALVVRAPRAIVHAQIVRNGEAIREVAPGSPEMALQFEDEECPVGHSYYYAAVTLEGTPQEYPSNVVVARGNRAWSSPVFLERR